MNHFKDFEFNCNCGCGLGIGIMRLSFLNKLDIARSIAETPFKITSGARCWKHNNDEGGSKTSSHLDGWAVDIFVFDSEERFKILKALLQAGFKRIGIRKDFIHVDDDPNKNSEVVWIY